MNDGDKTDSLNIADITVEDELEVGDVDEGEVSVKQVMMFMKRINIERTFILNMNMNWESQGW